MESTRAGHSGVPAAEAWSGRGEKARVRPRHVLSVRDRNGNDATDPGEIERDARTTVDSWTVKARYDRFITSHQGAFLGGNVGADRVAGKTLVGGGNAGWAAKLVKTAPQELVAELGYDCGGARQPEHREGPRRAEARAPGGPPSRTSG